MNDLEQRIEYLEEYCGIHLSPLTKNDINVISRIEKVVSDIQQFLSSNEDMDTFIQSCTIKNMTLLSMYYKRYEIYI